MRSRYAVTKWCPEAKRKAKQLPHYFKKDAKNYLMAASTYEWIHSKFIREPPFSTPWSSGSFAFAHTPELADFATGLRSSAQMARQP